MFDLRFRSMNLIFVVTLAVLALDNSAMAQKRPMAVGGSGTNTTTSTTSTNLAVDYVTTPAVLDVDNYSTTLVVLLDGKQISSQNFTLPYADPSVQTTVIQSQAALAAKGAGYGVPVMTSNTAKLQSTATAQPAIWDGTCASYQAGTAPPLPYGAYLYGYSSTTSFYIGPQTIMVGDCQATPFSIVAGGVDYDTLLITILHIPPVTTNSYLVSQTYTLSGTTGSGAQLSSISLAFPNISRGATAAELTTTLSNPGVSALTGITFSLGGANPGNFTLTSDTNCGSTLAPSASCTIAVEFTPSAVQSFTATLSITDNAAGSPQTVSLSGNGTGPQLQFSPAKIGIISGTAGSAGNTGNGGAASSALVGGGSGIAFDRAGNLYFSDSTYNTVRKIDTTGKISTFAGAPVSGTGSYSGDNGAAASAGLNSPAQIVFDQSGNLYIADRLNSVIRKIDSSGTITTFAGSYSAGACGYAGDNGAAASATLCHPQGVAVDALGNVYIADTGNNIVRKVDTGGTITHFAGAPGQTGNNGDGLAAFDALLAAPAQVAVDLAGNVYIADTGNNVVRRVSVNGIIKTFAGGGTYAVTPAPARDEIIKAVAVATDLAGNVYIASGSSIYMVSAGDADGNNQIISTIVGGGSNLTSGVSATQSGLGATGIAVDANGNLFVNDATDYLIYEAGPDGDLVFGNQAINSTSGTMSVTLINTGDETLIFSPPSATLTGTTFGGGMGVIAGDFIIGSEGDCDFAGGLPPGVSCTLSVNFTPTATGARTGTITLKNNALNSPSVIQLFGTGIVSGSTPPAPVINSEPANPTISTTAAFTFSDSQSGVTFQCSLDGSSYAACASGSSYSLLSSATHIFAVQAVDTAGDISPAATYSWTIDLPSAPTILSGPADPTTATAVSFTFSDAQSGVTFQCGWDSAPYTACVSGASHSALAAGAHTFAVLAVDGAGNSSNAAIYNWTVTASAIVAADFGTVPVGQTSAPVQLTLSFSGSGTIGSVAAMLQGAAASDFTVVSGGSCAVNQSFSNNGTCTANVTFSPQLNGWRHGAVIVKDSSGNTVATGPISGTGSGPQVRLIPRAVNFSWPSLGGGLSLQSFVVDGIGNAFAVVYTQTGTVSVEEIPVNCASASCVITLASNFTFPTVYTYAHSIAIDTGGNLFIAGLTSAGFGEIFEITAASGYQTITHLASNVSLGSISSIAVDQNDNIFILCWVGAASGVYEIPASGGYTTASHMAGSIVLLNAGGGNIAIDGRGNLFVSIASNSFLAPDSIFEVTAAGGYQTVNQIDSGFILGAPGAAYGTAADLTLDQDGNLFVLDSRTYSIYEVLASTGYTAVDTIGTGLGPNAVAVDARGDIYVPSGYAINKMDLSNAYITYYTATLQGSTDTTDTVGWFKVQNIGNAPLHLTAITPPSASFVINASTTTCTVPSILAVGASCVVGVDFAPGTSGALTGTLVITDDALNTPGAKQPVHLTGTGTALAVPVIDSEPDSLTIQTSAAFTFSDSQPGATFRCSLDGAPFTACESGVNYTSLAFGAHTFAVEAVDDTSSASVAATYSWTIDSIVLVTVGTTPNGLTFNVDGTSYTGTQTLGWIVGSSHTLVTTSPQTSGGTQNTFASWSDGGAISHTVTAPSSAASYTATFTTSYQLTTAASPVSGGTVTPVSGSYYSSGTVLNLLAAPNSGYTFTNWTGNVVAANSASTTVTMSAPQSVTANFSVITAPIASLTAPPAFPATATGTTSAMQTATLSNTGNAALTISGITITGTNPSDFGIATGTNACGTTLAAGATCSIYVTFTPASATSFAAALSVADNASGSPHTAALTGTGTAPPNFTIASPTGAQTVQPGGTATYNINITPVNGPFTSAITLAASGIPTGATANFSPASITPGNSVAASTLSIKTSSTMAAVPGIGSFWPLAAPILSLIGLFLVPGKRRRRLITLGVLLLASCCALTALSGCGGGFSLARSPQSFTVTVTGTSGALVQTTTVQLTIQ